jgi:hypothetical protein
MTIEDTRPRLRYLATNESLLAIRHGLAIGPQDVLLSIAAAGDQAFAMLEFAKKVVVVDSNPKQLRYFEKQVGLLRDRDYLSFLKPQMLLRADPLLGYDVEQLEAFNGMGLAQRRKYFTPLRLDSIRKNLDALIISTDTVLDALDAHAFNKAYLTNIIGYLDSDFKKGSLLFAGANKIKVGGLVYLSNAVVRPGFMDFMQGLGLEHEKELTAVARALEPNWKPDVFKRVK